MKARERERERERERAEREGGGWVEHVRENSGVAFDNGEANDTA